MNKLIVAREDGNQLETENIPGLDIEWLGENGIVKIYTPFKLQKCYFQVANDGFIEIKTNTNLFGLYIRLAASNSSVRIGKNFIASSAQFILARGGFEQTISIGDNCLFSSDISIFTSDGHSIFDTATQKLLNKKGGNIEIGHHCWLGHGVCLTKTAKLSNNSIVASKSLVNKSFNEENIILGGVPAKIIKKYVNWDICHPDEYKLENKNDN